MPTSSKIKTVHCDHCGFVFNSPVYEDKEEIVCPSCGVASNGIASKHHVPPAPSRPYRVDSKTSDTIASPKYLARRRSSPGWRILFSTVCVQLVLLIVSIYLAAKSDQRPDFDVRNTFHALLEKIKPTADDSETDALSDVPAKIDPVKSGNGESVFSVVETSPNSVPDSMPSPFADSVIAKAPLPGVPKPSDFEMSPFAEKSPLAGALSSTDSPFMEKKVVAEKKGEGSAFEVAINQTNTPAASHAVSSAPVAKKAVDPTMIPSADPLHSAKANSNLTPHVSPFADDPFAPSVSPFPGVVEVKSSSDSKSIGALKSSVEKPSIEKQLAEKQLAEYEKRLGRARELFGEAQVILPQDPSKSLKTMLESIKLFEELGQSLPSGTYGTLGQAFAGQSWGEALIENSLPIENMAVSSDSRWLLAQYNDNTLWIWDLSRPQGNQGGFKLDTGSTSFVKLLFSPDLQFAIGGQTDGSIRIWNTTLRNPAEAVIVLPDNVKGLKDIQVSPDGCWLIAYGGSTSNASARSSAVGDGNENGSNPFTISWKKILDSKIDLVGFQNAETNLLRATEEKGKSGFDGDSSLSRSLRSDWNAVWLWNLRQIQEGKTPQPILLRGHDKPIRVMKISDDSRWLVTGSEDATARVYDLKGNSPGTEQAVLKGHQLDVTALAIAPNSRYVATGSRDNTIRIWSLMNSGTTPTSQVLTGHLGWISSLVIDPTGNRLISGSYDKTIRVWKIPQGSVSSFTPSEPTVIYGDQGIIRELELSKDGKTLVSQGTDSSIRLRIFADSTMNDDSVIIRNRSLPISRFAMTPDSRWLVFNFLNQGNTTCSGVRLWPLRYDDLLKSVKSSGNP